MSAGNVLLDEVQSIHSLTHCFKKSLEPKTQSVYIKKEFIVPSKRKTLKLVDISIK